MAVKVYVEAGNTVVIRCTFTDPDEDLLDIDVPTLNIYTDKMVLLHTDTDNVVRESEGVYSCRYETPTETSKKKYFCEISGTVDGFAVLDRGEFYTVFKE